MSVSGNVKRIGGPIISVLRRLVSNDGTEVVDDTTSLNEALLEAVKEGTITKGDALKIAKDYVDSEKKGKSFAKAQTSGLKSDTKNTIEFGTEDDKEVSEGSKDIVPDKPDKETDDRDLTL